MLQEYIELIKKIYQSILEYVECESADDLNLFYEKLLDNFQIFFQRNSLNHFKMLLSLILIISNNHCRSHFFIERIENIFLILSEQIKQILPNLELLDFFSSNKLILHILFKNGIIKIDQSVVNYLLQTKDLGLYFYFQIKPFLNDEQQKMKEKELLLINDNIFNIFNEKTNLFDNDSYICSIIRQDAVVEFISYINRESIPLTSTIKPSLFETNEFLINNKKVSLIEYAAFYGSIQIFQYLKMNDVELTSSLWLYAIHSNNAELINILEENHVNPIDKSYYCCLLESIKCHHNDIAQYLIETHCVINEKEHFDNILRYYNFSFFPENLSVKTSFLNLGTYGYYDFLDLYFESKKKEYNKYKKIPNSFQNALTDNKFDHVYYSLMKKNNIPNDYFRNSKYLSAIIIPPSIKSINRFAFYRCKSLTKVKLPYSLEKIGFNAFFGCSSLEEISIPSFVTKIGNGAFSGCSSLKQITIPYSVTSIGDNVFEKCSSLEQIQIPSSVKQIGNYAFFGCSSLARIQIPSSLTSIGDNAFEKCSSLEQIQIPSSVKKIGNYAFYRCSSLKQIQIPSSVKQIGNYVFFGCSSLKQTQVPSSVTSIGDNDFEECSSLTETSTPFSVASECFERLNNPLYIKVTDDHPPTFPKPLTENIKNLIIRCWKASPSDRPTFNEIYKKLSGDFVRKRNPKLSRSPS